MRRDDQIKAGAEDAARELGVRVTSSSARHHWVEDTAYSFRFDAGGLEARVEFSVSDEEILRSGNTARDYARNEILEALGTADS